MFSCQSACQNHQHGMPLRLFLHCLQHSRQSLSLGWSSHQAAAIHSSKASNGACPGPGCPRQAQQPRSSGQVGSRGSQSSGRMQPSFPISLLSPPFGLLLRVLCVLSWLHSWGACGGADSDSGSGGVLTLRLPLLLHSIALLSLLSFSYWVSKLVAGPLLDPSVHLMPRPSSCACNSAYLINSQIMTFQFYCPEFALDDSCLAAKRNTG